MGNQINGDGWAWTCLDAHRNKAFGGVELCEILIKGTWSNRVVSHVGHCHVVGCPCN